MCLCEATSWSPRPLSVLGNIPTRVSSDNFKYGTLQMEKGVGSMGQDSAVDVDWCHGASMQQRFLEIVGTCGAGSRVLLTKVCSHSLVTSYTCVQVVSAGLRQPIG